VTDANLENVLKPRSAFVPEISAFVPRFRCLTTLPNHGYLEYRFNIVLKAD
jgi:hypothetical protein